MVVWMENNLLGWSYTGIHHLPTVADRRGFGPSEAHHARLFSRFRFRPFVSTGLPCHLWGQRREVLDLSASFSEEAAREDGLRFVMGSRLLDIASLSSL